MKTVALVRKLPRRFAAGAIRSNPLAMINQEVAQKQHDAYTDVLVTILGRTNVIILPAEDSLADSSFIEDTAVVVRPYQSAIVLSMAAIARQNEAESVARCLKKLGVKVYGTSNKQEQLDGGDVLQCGNKFLVGLSSRTNVLGAKRFEQHMAAISPGTAVEFIKVPVGLHLKSICTRCGPKSVVAWSGAGDAFLTDLKKKLVDIKIHQVSEMEASNCLYIESQNIQGGSLSTSLVLRKDIRSAAIIEDLARDDGVSSVYHCDMSEMAKADGALTCCSILLDLPR